MGRVGLPAGADLIIGRRELTRLVVVLSFLYSAIPAAATAQNGDCTYRSCALRVSGSKVVVGQGAEEVASFGWFSPPELRPLVERSDSAMHYQEILDANYTSGKVMMWGGLAMTTASIWRLSFSSLHDSESGTGGWVALGVGAAGLVLGVIGGRRLDRANEALSQTIWWYNESLVDPSLEDDSKAPADPRPTVDSGVLERRR